MDTLYTYNTYNRFSEYVNTLMSRTSWNAITSHIVSANDDDIRRILSKDECSIYDLPALLSPAAETYLEEMAQKSHALTLARFGRTVLLYVPLYVSNYCTNKCVYCGFNADNDVERLALSVDETVEESTRLHDMGFRHILLVSGEHPQYAHTNYLIELAERLRHMFSSVCIEVQPLSQNDYAHLISAGVDCVTCYQETYNPKRYAEVHPGGPKRDYDARIDTLGRAAKAGIRKVGLSPLYGLDNWRTEALFTGLHCHFLMTHYWQTHPAISFPRLRAAAGGFEPQNPLPDAGLAQLISAFRLCLHDVHLVLSTREPAHLRDALLPLGITQMSAASRTAPLGYSHDGDAEPQFSVLDTRSSHDVANAIIKAGYEPVWKDWDEYFLNTATSA